MIYEKVYKVSLSLLILVFIIVEIFLRVIWGFGTMSLYVESKQYEYIFAPMILILHSEKTELKAGVYYEKD